MLSLSCFYKKKRVGLGSLLTNVHQLESLCTCITPPSKYSNYVLLGAGNRIYCIKKMRAEWESAIHFEFLPRNENLPRSFPSSSSLWLPCSELDLSSTIQKWAGKELFLILSSLLSFYPEQRQVQQTTGRAQSRIESNPFTALGWVYTQFVNSWWRKKTNKR